MKKGILVVSFGTTYRQARENAIDVIEEMIADTFGDYEVYRAFTSSIVRKRMEEKEGIVIFGVEEALRRMKADGVTDVYIQSTHIIPGAEYEKVLAAVKKLESEFSNVKIGKPLLWETCDYEAVADILNEVYEFDRLEKRQAVVLMGHGTEHKANECYEKFQKVLRQKGYAQVFVSTVEGQPDFDALLEMLDKTDYRQLILGTFMLVAGDHAQNDLFGMDEDSWKNQLEKKGYEVGGNPLGLGELDAIGRLFVKHLEKAIEA